MLRSVVLLGGLFTSSMADPSIPVNYCSSLNTAPMAANYSIHQTQGLCYNFCVEKNYALAIVQVNNCWCSNFVPDSSKQVSPGQCNSPCPGYPTDVCGTDNLFGYMLGQQKPSGTASTGQAGTTSKPPTNTSPSVETVTADGTVRTVTVAPNPTGTLEENQTTSPAATGNGGNGGGSGLSTGATAGVAVGTIAVATIAIVFAFLFFRRRRQRRDDESLNRGPSPRGSSAGMGSPRSTEPGMAQTDGKPWDPTDQSGRRRSTLMPIDPRIDPTHTAIYNREQNTSRDSINTLRDDQDYSRRVHQPTKVLRATNPDPDLD